MGVMMWVIARSFTKHHAVNDEEDKDFRQQFQKLTIDSVFA